MSDVTIRHDLQPGDIGYLVYLHGILYAKEYGWDSTFEAEAATVFAEIANSRGERERIWLVEKDGRLSGSIAIVEAAPETAQLRVLLLHPDLRGLGMGRRLVEEAVAFTRERGYSSIFLLTTSNLYAAAHIYKSVGFHLEEEEEKRLWGVDIVMQRYGMKLS